MSDLLVPFKSTLSPSYNIKKFVDSSSSSSSSDDEEEKEDKIISVSHHRRRNFLVQKSQSISDQKMLISLMKELGIFEREALIFAKIIRRESLKRIHVANAMNYVLSIGGGWASVKNSKNARICSRVLSALAASIGDEATVRRCEIFEGYASSWEGKNKTNGKNNKKHRTSSALKIKQKDELNGDGANEHGLKNLLWDFDANDKKI
jgi:hypothetical protein